MSRFHSYINTAKKLIEAYKGDRPFATFLKLFFTANKKYGSGDRRHISALCYGYFRLGFSCNGTPPEKKMLMAVFLCETKPSEVLESLQPQWNHKILRPLRVKMAMIKPPFAPTTIFPFNDELSDGIEPVEFCRSFLIQPDLFIRIRPQTKISALKKLEKIKLPYQLTSSNCVRLNNSDKIEDVFIINKEIVVQDYNSQKVFDYLKNGDCTIDSIQPDSKSNLAVWDCCAASGGKSILLNDTINRKIDLTVSDIRANIILMLHRRFKKAGIKEYKYFIEDITRTEFKPGEMNFDLIICDAPCTGSGTWSRTPEQLCFFKAELINDYNELQKKIVTGIIPHLKTGGLLVYITCSVFKKENEVIAGFITETFGCKLLNQQLLKGYDKKADTMYVAVFRKLPR